ncbi:hypothetical protein DSM25559_5193 [Agrobacterium rosae]|uniref:Uncharacterized protein n=1 Tax=Agrobacterium rosae TaxID=1972867 RepID=A0A1R3U312_9HYPH|nr:hypothetical protein DSM25559_5193 [Agrobacterium rosae]
MNATKENAMSKHWSGQVCPATGTYGQYHDTDNSYAGVTYDKHVKSGERFPPSKNNYHFKLK